MTQFVIASAFIHQNGKLLIAKRADTKKFLPGIYEIPGGHVEFGETPELALQREVKEEIGIDVVVGEPFAVFSYLSSTDRHGVEIDYYATLASDDQVVQLNPADHSEYRWIGPDEVDAIFDYNVEVRTKLAASGPYRDLTAEDPVRAVVKKGFARLHQQEETTYVTS